MFFFQDENTMTALHLAAMNGHYSTVEILLRCGSTFFDSPLSCLSPLLLFSLSEYVFLWSECKYSNSKLWIHSSLFGSKVDFIFLSLSLLLWIDNNLGPDMPTLSIFSWKTGPMSVCCFSDIKLHQWLLTPFLYSYHIERKGYRSLCCCRVIIILILNHWHRECV